MRQTTGGDIVDLDQDVARGTESAHDQVKVQARGVHARDHTLLQCLSFLKGKPADVAILIKRNEALFRLDLKAVLCYEFS